jgi:CxxC-x17-CxxC domain-containing protein
MKNINFWNANIDKLKTQFKEFSLKYPHKHSRFINIENSIGDDLINAKNAYNCFGCEDVEDVRYCYFVNEAKNCMDMLYYWSNIERAYRSCSAWSNSQNIYFCSDCYENVNNLYYCDNCWYNTKNCFGCIGLNKKEYCILNKEYTKEEYENLVPKIINKMKTDWERWAFFPPTYSPFGYNESFAMEHFPLSKEEAIKKWFNWMDAEYNIDVPKNLEADPEIINCEVTLKPFRITKQELNFYEKMGLPLPTKHPNQRHKERFEQVNKKKLWNNKCDKCWIEIQTTYSPEKKEIVYCEDCYNKEIY